MNLFNAQGKIKLLLFTNTFMQVKRGYLANTMKVWVKVSYSRKSKIQVIIICNN